MNERDLLVVYKSARQELDSMKEQLKEVQKRYDEAETAMVEHLTANQAEATAKYDGIGYAKLMKPRVYASCLKENEDKLKAYLVEHGREDLIKEVVAAPSLSAYVGELVEAGKPIPDLISYYLKQGVRLY
jgi:hypothetical protein